MKYVEGIKYATLVGFFLQYLPWEVFCFPYTVALLLLLLLFSISKYLASSVGMCTLDSAKSGLAVLHLAAHPMQPSKPVAIENLRFLKAFSLFSCCFLTLGKDEAVPFFYHKKGL